MTAARLVRLGLRRLVGWWWQAARPSAGGSLAGSGAVARPAHETGRPPRPDERWTASAPATGPWALVDPQTTGRWPRRASLAAVAVWGAMVGWRVRRDVRAWTAQD